MKKRILSLFTLSIAFSCAPITTQAISLLKNIAIGIFTLANLGESQTVTALDSGGLVSVASLDLDAMGNPSISFLHREPDFGIKFLECKNPGCDSVYPTKAITSDYGDISMYSFRRNGEGNPLILYVHNGTDLNLATCADIHCNSFSVKTLDTVPPPLMAKGRVVLPFDNIVYPFLHINNAGNPVISYVKTVSGRELFHLIVCVDPTCRANIFNVVDEMGDICHYSLQINSKDNPVISFTPSSFDNELKIIVCGNPTCSCDNVINLIKPKSDTSFFSSLQLDQSDNPSIVCNTFTDLTLATCIDLFCSANIRFEPIHSKARHNEFISYTYFEISNNAYPVISYVTFIPDTSWSAKVAVCKDLTCMGNNSVLNIQERNTTYLGYVPPMVLDRNGNIILVIEDGNTLKVVTIPIGTYYFKHPEL